MSEPNLIEINEVLMKEVAELIGADDAFEDWQTIYANSPADLTPPFLLYQSDVAGAAPGFEGSAYSGIWDVMVSVTPTRHRVPDSDADEIRLAEGHVRRILFDQLSGGFPDLNKTLPDGRTLKVWHLGFESTQSLRDENYDGLLIPVRLYAALIWPEPST